MRSKEVQRQVAEFRNRTAGGETDDDCFVPWYLQTKFHVPDGIALEHSSSGGEEKRKNWDLGLDGYHLLGDPNPKSLLLIQAKYSDSVTYIAKGFTDFIRLLNFLSNSLVGRDIDVPEENHVLVNLRRDLKKLDRSILDKLELDFRLIHLRAYPKIEQSV